LGRNLLHIYYFIDKYFHDAIFRTAVLKSGVFKKLSPLKNWLERARRSNWICHGKHS